MSRGLVTVVDSETAASNVVQVGADGALTEYDVTDASIGSGITNSSTVTPEIAVSVGFVYRLSVSSSLSAGTVTVKVFDDVAKTNEIYSATFDLSQPSTLKDNIPFSYESDQSDGRLYFEITNNSGTSGTFSVNAKAAILVAGTPDAGNLGTTIGDGLGPDGNGRTRVDIGTSSGLELSGTTPSKQLRVKGRPTDPVYVRPTSTGTEVVNALSDQTQNISGVHRYQNGVGIAEGASAGPPSTGTWVVGDIYRDSDGVLWECTGTGPLVWKLVSRILNHVSATYTASVAADSSVTIEIPTTGRRGMVYKMIIWAFDDSEAAVNIDEAFRVQVFPDENVEDRDMIFEVLAQARATYLSGAASAASDVVPLNTVDVMDLQNLVVIRDVSAGTEEYGRVEIRRTSPVEIDLGEVLDASYAANDLCAAAVELILFPWWNSSTTVGEEQKLFMKLRNLAASQAVKFGYEMWIEEFGGEL